MTSQNRLRVSETSKPFGAAKRSEFARPLKDEELAQVQGVTGFPRGTVDAIQAMSVPPYYTACPNPFLGQIVAQWQAHRQAQERRNPPEYKRAPYAYDVSEGKHDPTYKIHSYHTKVPPRAIARYILHYTRPGDIVLDAFCGSGMTGVAAQLCGAPSPSLKTELEAEREAAGQSKPEWGYRHAVLCDLSPVATTIAANYNLPLEAALFEQNALEILKAARQAVCGLYSATPEEKPFEYAVWSQIFLCPACNARLNFMELAYDRAKDEIKSALQCPACDSRLEKRDLEKLFESKYDPLRKDLHRQVVHEPYLVARGNRWKRELRPVTAEDLAALARAAEQPWPYQVPVVRLPLEQMYHGSRLGPKGMEYIHDLYFHRQLISLGTVWELASQVSESRLRSALRFWIDQVFLTASRLARYPQRSPLGGVYYVPSMAVENEPLGLLEKKIDRMVSFYAAKTAQAGQVVISTNSAAQIPGLPDESVDYVFTDPPFGENIFYADLNFVTEAWYGVFTAVDAEAIVDQPKKKGLREYERLMFQAFSEYCRVLKLGHWITVVFHNSNNAVWNAIQTSMTEAGFIIADVRTLDKQQRSYRQVTSNAVKQDLIISAYKPEAHLIQRIISPASGAESAWAFVREHLKFLPVFLAHEGEVELIRERDAHMLYDRMVAAHVQRGQMIPVDFGDFLRGLYARFLERDGMFFLPDQVVLYDRERMRASRVEQLALFVNDEKSALQWLNRELDPATGSGPQTYSDLQPKFLKELNQVKYEALPELKRLLEDNFLLDQHNRWFLPDPDRRADIEQLRQKSLLREFAQYRKEKGRLRTFRSEAVRAGFSQAWKERDYDAILAVAERLPEALLLEDPALKMYYDNAHGRAAQKPKQGNLF